MLGEDKTEIINQHKNKRIDAQYYMKVDKEEQVSKMLLESKRFVFMFDEIVSNLGENEIREYRRKLKEYEV